MPKKMWIAGDGGTLVPKPGADPRRPRPRPQRFYNWPKDYVPAVKNKKGEVVERHSKPVGEAFVKEVPWDEYHRRLYVKGVIRLAKPSEIPGAKKPGKKAGGDA